jgi:hypothetical protein
VKNTGTVSSRANRELAKALDVYRGFHWGKIPKAVLVMPDIQLPKPVKVTGRAKPCRIFNVLGEMTGIVYRTTKGRDGEPVLYVHSFDEPFPLLATDNKRKQLFILGGGYTIEDRGIVH